MKFLIIRFSSIGDIVLTTPVLRCLKKQIPTAEIHYLTKKIFSSLLISNPYVHKLHTIHNDVQEAIPALQAEDFDYVIDLHHNLRSLKIKKALKKPSFSFLKLNIEKWLLTTFKINKLPPVHIVDRYMQTLQSFGVENDEAGLDYFIPAAECLKDNDIPTSHKAGYIAVVVGAAHGTKQYPLENLQQFCQAIQHPVIVVGGKEDIKVGEQLAAINEFKIYNACGKFTLHESADLVKQAKLVITNDTGFMHIAAAFKRPIISLWGNTVPAFGMYPYYGHHFLNAYANHHALQPLPYDMVEVATLSCRPCSKIGHATCPKKHFNCMRQIDPSHLLALAEKRIRS
jgi:ADP-heptose:LPS heptosyltransferase